MKGIPHGLKLLLGILLSLQQVPLQAAESPLVKPPLYIGIPTNRQPYSYRDANQQAHGLLVDAIKPVCQQMKVTCNFVTGNFDELIQDLQHIKLNAVAVVDAFIFPEIDGLKLTRPLCHIEPAFIQAKSAPARNKPEDFQGATIGMLEGSIFHTYLLDTYSSQARLMPYSLLEDAIFDLTFKRVDAVLADESFIKARVLDTPLGKYASFTTTRIEAPELPATSMVLALREQDDDLFKELDKALQATPQDQTCLQLLTTANAKQAKE